MCAWARPLRLPRLSPVGPEPSPCEWRALSSPFFTFDFVFFLFLINLKTYQIRRVKLWALGPACRARLRGHRGPAAPVPARQGGPLSTRPARRTRPRTVGHLGDMQPLQQVTSFSLYERVSTRPRCFFGQKQRVTPLYVDKSRRRSPGRPGAGSSMRSPQTLPLWTPRLEASP